MTSRNIRSTAVTCLQVARYNQLEHPLSGRGRDFCRKIRLRRAGFFFDYRDAGSTVICIIPILAPTQPGGLACALD